jgi:DNA repair protein RadA/Sms
MKTKTTYVCQECGYDTPGFMGKCPECGAWNSLKEMRFAKGSKSSDGPGIVSDMEQPVELGKVAYRETSRMLTEFNELNTVLGGGIVYGSATLIAGDPGVGKSTLLLQLCLSLAKQGIKVLYISGEESAEQIKMRADRLLKQDSGKKPVKSDWSQNILLLSTSDPDYAIEQVLAIGPQLIVVDSVQTMQSKNLEGLAGAVGQVRYTALNFIRIAKQKAIPLILVGHVTKEGMVAGPMVLSHMVDTVLFLEGEKFAKTRILRSLKNRFGPVDEVGIFMMEEEGMLEVTNPEQLFLSDNREHAPGSVLVATLEGTRAFLVELQALVVYSKLPMPRRVVSGMDSRRVELLLAVLQKHARLPVETMDVFVNVAGGLKLSDPGVDLGICLAIFSSLKDISLPGTVGIAEVGLLGELRAVAGLEKRTREAEKLGYKQVITAKTHKGIRDVLYGLTPKEKGK